MCKHGNELVAKHCTWRSASVCVCICVVAQACVCVCVRTHRMCVGAIGAEGQGDGGVEDAELTDHLLHAADGALFVRVGELDHQAGGGALG